MPDPSKTETYFTDRVSDYVAHRPSYPDAVFAAVLEGLDPPVVALDIGCGTGISTRGLAVAGATVTGVDPNDAMLETACHDTHDARATYALGSAEHLDHPSGHVDLVFCAQSFHWFDAPRALADFHRVLRPGGRLALAWNVRDIDDPVGAAYQSIIGRAQDDAAAAGRTVERSRTADPTTTGHFTNARVMRFANPQPLSREGLIGRALSASYFPKSGALHEQLCAELDELATKHAQDGVVTLGQITEVTIADRT